MKRKSHTEIEVGDIVVHKTTPYLKMVVFRKLERGVKCCYYNNITGLFVNEDFIVEELELTV